mmetsp:Transcript_86587/g.279530  ORF Transcript_86587/g.279530 Transcript_86587/m.279530 type:complete len:258 (+) Transcript_86587:741-1514(+)
MALRANLLAPPLEHRHGHREELLDLGPVALEQQPRRRRISVQLGPNLGQGVQVRPELGRGVLLRLPAQALDRCHEVLDDDVVLAQLSRQHLTKHFERNPLVLDRRSSPAARAAQRAKGPHRRPAESGLPHLPQVLIVADLGEPHPGPKRGRPLLEFELNGLVHSLQTGPRPAMRQHASQRFLGLVSQRLHQSLELRKERLAATGRPLRSTPVGFRLRVDRPCLRRELGRPQATHEILLRILLDLGEALHQQLQHRVV